MHIFITGEKRIGKSTLVQKIAACFSQKTGGFRTVRTESFLPGSASVHLLAAQGEEGFSQGNLLFVCGKRDGDVSERFSRLGCAALEGSDGCALLMMDELGPHEAQATAFREMVMRCADGSVPILGVLQAPAEKFWPELVRHPNVHLFCLTEENRQEQGLVQRLAALLKTE